MAKVRKLAPFYGAFSAIDSGSIPETAAADHLNARIEDGAIRFRYGYRNLADTQSGATAVHGLGYLQGYSGTTETEEYVTAETVSGNTRFYSRNVSTGAATEITNGGVSVNVNGSEWVFAPYDDDAYFINPNNSVPIFRHTIGTNNSLTGVAVPTAPAAAPSYTVLYGPGGTSDYDTLSWAGLDPTNSGELACSGAATNTGSALNSDGTFNVRHTNDNIESAFEVDMNDITAGVQDWADNDVFQMSVRCRTTYFGIQVTKVEVRNNDGTPKVLAPNLFSIQKVEGSNGTGTIHNIVFGWSDKTRADFDNARYLKVYYTVTKSSSTVANNELVVSKLVVGGVDMSVPTDTTPDPDGLEIGYSYYFSTPGFESGISPALFIPNDILDGRFFGGLFMGVHIRLALTDSVDSNVDNYRIYARKKGSDVWYRLATQSDATDTYDLKLTYVEISRLTQFEPTPFTFENVTNAFAYKGSMVWLYKGGSSNVRFSRIGDPLRQASSEDPMDDTSAGETFTLADNAADEPLGGIQAGDGVMIAGKYGVHASIGDRPVEMIPFRRVAGSSGAAGKYAFCRYKDDNGMVGIAYMNPHGQVLLSTPGAFNEKEVGGTINLSNLVRDGELSPKDFLLEEQASALSLTDFSTCQVFYDDAQDSLWVVMGLRAMVLRRPNLLSGARYWEHYDFNTGSSSVTVRYCSGSGKRRLKWMRSNGKFDEVEYNSTTRAFISGSNSDGGNAAPSGYWESKRFRAVPGVRIMRVDVERDDYTDTPTLTVYTSGNTSGEANTVSTGRPGCKVSPTSYGTWYSVRVSLSETYEPIRSIDIMESKVSRSIFTP